MANCKFCNKDFDNDKSLHAHLKSHKISVSDYYQHHYPRKDLLTGEIIEFKNKDQYFESDFNSKINFKKWAKSSDPKIVGDYCKGLLQKRQEKKKSIYPFSQVELKSSGIPSINFLETVIGDYYDYCDNNGFEKKFLNPKNLLLIDNFIDDYCIYVDTREQKPLEFSRLTQVKKLNFGDYCFENLDVSGNTFIERKSLKDFIGTLAGGYDRFCREIERAAENNSSIIVVVENDLATCLRFNYLPYIARNTKVNPDFIFHKVRMLMTTYKNVQFLFVDGREECVRVIEKIFVNKDISLNYDLQLLYDIEKL